MNFLKKYFIHIILIVFVISIYLALSFLYLKRTPEYNKLENIPNSTVNRIDEKKDLNQKDNSSCGYNFQLFTHSPLEKNAYTSITPLGNLNPPGHTFPTDHIYFMLTKVRKSNDGNALTKTATIFSPGDITITEIRTSEHLSEKPIFVDYDISFSVCSEVSFKFGHITTLAKSLLSEIKNLPKDSFSCNSYIAGEKKYKACRYDVNIKVEEGEKIGTAGGRLGQNALDLFGNDTRADKPILANPTRWEFGNGDMFVAVCPLDYFTPDLKKYFESKLGNESSKRVGEPICGTSYQDIPNTAQGVWFVSGTANTYPEDPHIALVHDNINLSKPAFSIGTSLRKIGIQSGVYTYSIRKSGLINRDFNKIKPSGNIYCFELKDSRNNSPFTINLSMLDSNSLAISKGAKNKCIDTTQIDAKKSVKFER